MLKWYSSCVQNAQQELKNRRTRLMHLNRYKRRNEIPIGCKEQDREISEIISHSDCVKDGTRDIRFPKTHELANDSKIFKFFQVYVILYIAYVFMV